MPVMPDGAVDAYPLTPLQQGILYHVLAEPGGGRYVQQVECELTGELDAGALRRAWLATVDRHEVLRSAFYWEGLSEPLQVVYATADPEWTTTDHSGLDGDGSAVALAEFRAADLARGIDLGHAPLMRCALTRTGPGRHRFLWTHHHIVLDGSSFTLVLAEVFDRYHADVTGAEYRPLPVPRFRDHVAMVRAVDRAAALDFWRARLADVGEPTAIPGLRDGDGLASAAEENRVLSREVTARLTAFGRRHRLGTATLAAAAWARAVAGRAGTTDAVFGMTVGGRPVGLPNAESAVGLFINTVPVRIRLHPDGPTPGWLAGVQDELLAVRDVEQTPLVDAQGCARVPRGVPLFESLLLVQSYADEPPHPPGRAGITLELVGSEPPRTGYPVTVMVVPGETWRLRLIHDTSAVDRDTARRLLDAFEWAIGTLTGPPDAVPPCPAIDDVVRIQVAGTFTVTAMAETYAFWQRLLGLTTTVGFGRYGQVHQELLDQGSPLACAAHRLLFVRLADLGPPEGLASAVDDLAGAIAAPATGRGLVVLCPSPGDAADEPAAARLRDRLAATPRVDVVDAVDLCRPYGVDRVHDPAAARAGHLPYTAEFLAALATGSLRRVVAEAAPGPAALVLDGDGLLWAGAAGEDATAGDLGSPADAVLRRAVRWRAAGRPVALAARGRRADVEAALARFCPSLGAPEVLRVGWEPVSAALAEVADDLALPERELLYLTADPVNWAEATGNRPGVRTVLVRSASFVEHLWLLDAGDRAEGRARGPR